MAGKGVKRKGGELEQSTRCAPRPRPTYEKDPALYREYLINLTLTKIARPSRKAHSPRISMLLNNLLKVLQADLSLVFPCSNLWNNLELFDSRGPPPAGAMSLSSNMEDCLGYLPEDLKNLTLPSVEEDRLVSDAIDIIMRELGDTSDSCMQSSPYPGADDQGLSYYTPPTPPPSPVFDELGEAMDTSPETCSGSSNADDLLEDLILSAECSQHLPEIPIDWDAYMLDGTTEPNCETPSSHQPSTAVGSFYGVFEITQSSYLNGISLNDRFLDIDTSVFEMDSPGPSTTSQLPPAEDVWIESYCSPPSCILGRGNKESIELENIMEALVGY